MKKFALYYILFSLILLFLFSQLFVSGLAFGMEKETQIVIEDLDESSALIKKEKLRKFSDIKHVDSVEDLSCEGGGGLSLEGDLTLEEELTLGKLFPIPNDCLFVVLPQFFDKKTLGVVLRVNKKMSKEVRKFIDNCTVKENWSEVKGEVPFYCEPFCCPSMDNFIKTKDELCLELIKKFREKIRERFNKNKNYDVVIVNFLKIELDKSYIAKVKKEVAIVNKKKLEEFFKENQDYIVRYIEYLLKKYNTNCWYELCDVPCCPKVLCWPCSVIYTLCASFDICAGGFVDLCSEKCDRTCPDPYDVCFGCDCKKYDNLCDENVCDKLGFLCCNCFNFCKYKKRDKKRDFDNNRLGYEQIASEDEKNGLGTGDKKDGLSESDLLV